MAIVGMALVLGLSGCAGGPEAASDAGFVGEPTSRSAAGDWNDVGVAVTAAGMHMEMVVVSAGQESVDGLPDPDRRSYRLLTVTDEPVLVEVRRVEGPAFEVSARVGRFGDPEREEELIGWISRRLDELAGVDVHPVGW